MNRILVLCLVVVILSLSLFGITLAIRGRDVNHAAAQAQQVHAALCSFKTDLEHRRDATALFVQQVQLGLRAPIPGISVSDLKRSLAGQQAALSSLSILQCP